MPRDPSTTPTCHPEQMSTPVTYALEGRPVTSEEFFDVIAGGGRQLAIQQMTAKIESVTCTQHGETAVVTEVDQSPEGFGFTISGCCDELIDRAHSAAAYPVDP
jgi:hypothetical protein